MPRLTPAELAARRKEKEEAEARKVAEQQEASRQAQIADQQAKVTFESLRTIQDVLYEEVDKLAKKAPKEQVSDYTLRKLNGHIQQVKAFLDSDPFLAEVHQFEAAGDNPEYRDAVLVLAELAAGLRRFRIQHNINWSSFR